MATKKQIEANRRNAKKSTGPKTPEGKAKSAQNALKHGLLASCPVLPEEDPMAYELLRANLHKELCPEGQLETLLVNRIAAAQWRLARVPGLEAALFERLRVPVPGVDGREANPADVSLGAAWERDAGAYGGALGRLARYETMLERSTTRLLAELRKLQAFRLRLERNELFEARRQADERRNARRYVDPLHQMDPAEAWLAARGGEPDAAPTEAAPQPAAPQPAATEAAFLRRAPQEPVSKLVLSRVEGGAAARDHAAHVPLQMLEGDRAQREGVDAGELPLPNEPDFITVPLRGGYGG
jgi:hypothetical protein